MNELPDDRFDQKLADPAITAIARTIWDGHQGSAVGAEAMMEVGRMAADSGARFSMIDGLATRVTTLSHGSHRLLNAEPRLFVGLPLQDLDITLAIVPAKALPEDIRRLEEAMYDRPTMWLSLVRPRNGLVLLYHPLI